MFSERGIRKNSNESNDYSVLVGTLRNILFNLDTVSEMMSEHFSKIKWVKVVQNSNFAGFYVQNYEII